MIQPIENADLSRLNSFGFESEAQFLIKAATDQDVCDAMNFAAQRDLPVLVLGGGSNLVLHSYVPGVVLQLSQTGYSLVAQENDNCLIDVEAGQNWHQLVTETVARGWYGLENLAFIPGTVGAAPVQNIGAYGVELKDRFVSLRAFDREVGQVVTLTASQCHFAYRDSLFKSICPGRYIILRIRLKLSNSYKPVLAYGALTQCLQNEAPEADEVLAAVIATRQSKLPDPVELGNAGSFFENPVIPVDQYKKLRMQYPQLVAFKDKPGFMKLAAGWLIDQAGWKGYREGNLGVYAKQALVLVNYGGGTVKDLRVLSEKIQASVYAKFGVSLSPEPRFYP
ncbi:MAG: UDP-N-acetylmuramate dehydrogenase [Pontibacterium sp.]